MLSRDLVAGLLLILAGCQTAQMPTASPAVATGLVAGAPCGKTQGPLATPENATEPGSGRKFYLEFPCNLKAGEHITLVLNLHGGGSFAGWQRLYFPAGDYAEKHRLVVATPTAAGEAKLPTSGASVRMWIEGNDDQYLRDLTDLLVESFGPENIKSFWLAGHSQGGITSTRIVCSDYFASRVDGFVSLAGGRVGMRIGGTPTCDYSHIFETGELDSAGVAGIPDTSPLADRFGCKPKSRLMEVVDTEAGKVYDPRGQTAQAPRAGWGGPAAPGTAEVYTFPDCRDGKVVADIVRLKKGHTEGLEPKITEEIVRMMTSIPGGKIRNGPR